MHYYIEKEVLDRRQDLIRNQRNANFVREWHATRPRNPRGVLEALVCRHTSWTPFQWCPKMPIAERQPYGQAPAGCEAEGSSLW